MSSALSRRPSTNLIPLFLKKRGLVDHIPPNLSSNCNARRVRRFPHCSTPWGDRSTTVPMADKTKKKPSFFTLRRWNSQSMKNDESPRMTPQSPRGQDSAHFFRSAVASRAANSTSEAKPRKMSSGGIMELVQCALCLEVLHNPRMLPCQHTFCLACLSVYAFGPNFLSELPSNLYIDSLLALVGVSPKPTTPPATPSASTVGMQSADLFASGARCAHCKTLCDNSAAGRLDHKKEHYKDRCDRITEQIKMAADEKINAIVQSKEAMLEHAAGLQKTSDMSALALKTSLEEARVIASRSMNATDDAKDAEQVNTFINLHQNAIQLLSDVSKWDSERFVFDKDAFRIEVDSTGPLDAESDEPAPEGARQHDPLESEESLELHYSPWDNNLYICGMDSHSVLVVERTQAKTVSRLSCEEMLCPAHIAFIKSLGEIYVTASWLWNERRLTISRLSCEEMLCPAHIAFIKSLGEIYVTGQYTAHLWNDSELVVERAQVDYIETVV
ncbi:Regucalcin [Operophtera brumata]|uniref:Regucalcin n=1 Tax=Operophtera brumata TaxID=104452 RepID=A0A0L7L224_OPEBR|nr:Regucalcin [Operophtera brumata]